MGDHIRAHPRTSVVTFRMPPSAESRDDSSTVAEGHLRVWREDLPKARVVNKFFLTKRPLRNLDEPLTMANIAKHNTRDDCWIIVDGKAYDVTKFIDAHPGGWL